MGRPLPENLQQSHNAILHAYRNYVPTVYPGRVTLFRAKTQLRGVYTDSTMGWGELVAGGV